MFQKKKKKTRITDKIKSYMSTVSVDVFNYEEIVIKNITTYFEAVSKQHNFSSYDIHLKIHQRVTLTGILYHKSTPVKRVTTTELIDFFTGKGSTSLLKLEQKVERSISNYLSDYAAISGIDSKQLIIVIAKPAQEIIVSAYREKQLIEVLSLKELIKYFKTTSNP